LLSRFPHGASLPAGSRIDLADGKCWPDMAFPDQRPNSPCAS
jgi:hypothetical protein